MEADEGRLDGLAEADKRLMSSLGIPAWAQVTGSDDWLRPRLFVWVDDAMALHSQLVGDVDPVHLRQLVARASEILSGRNDMRERGGLSTSGSRQHWRSCTITPSATGRWAERPR